MSGGMGAGLAAARAVENIRRGVAAAGAVENIRRGEAA